MAVSRCFDCLEEFADGMERFAVLKQMRDLPAECPPDEARDLQWTLVDPVFVCADCAGWYGDHPIAVTVDEVTA
jgi:hypothetical protein